MFSDEHCDFDSSDLRAAASGSYAVLAGIAAGLDWDKADAPDAQLRAEIMLWSLAHGYAQVRERRPFASRAAGRTTVEFSE